MRFVAEHLAILLVLRRQVEKEKEARAEVERSTRYASNGVPKATPLKRAFRKLWAKYEPSLKLYTQAERDAANVVHRTPSLSLQLTGARDQDHVPWGRWTKYESNCPVCMHASTMPMQDREGVLLPILGYARRPRQMEAMENSRQLRRRLDVTAGGRTVLVTEMALGVGSASIW